MCVDLDEYLYDKTTPSVKAGKHWPKCDKTREPKGKPDSWKSNTFRSWILKLQNMQRNLTVEHSNIYYFASTKFLMIFVF